MNLPLNMIGLINGLDKMFLFHHQPLSEKEIQKQIDETSTEELINDGFIKIDIEKMNKQKIQIANMNLKEKEEYKQEYDKEKDLISIDFSNCNLKKIEDILNRKDTSHLTTLTLDNNNIIEFSEDLPFIPKLERLWINNNNISNLELFLLRISISFPNLLYLSLIGNPCCKLDKEYRLKIISKLKNLIFLDMYPVKEEERNEIKKEEIIEDDSSDDSNSSNDGFESQDEEKELLKKIEKTKNEIKQQKDYIQELFKNKKREEIELESKKLIEFFNLNEFPFLKNHLLIKEQLKIGLENLKIILNQEIIEKQIQLLEELNELFREEKNEIEKQIEMIKKERERLQKEEMERIERKKIMDEYKRLENIERERTKRLIERRKEKQREEKEMNKKIENDFNFQLLDEQELIKDKIELDEKEMKERLKKYLF